MAKDSIPGIPDLPRGVDPALRPVLQALIDVVRTRTGQTKNALDRSPTVRELFGADVVGLRGTTVLHPNDPAAQTPASGTVYTAPPKPADVEARGLFDAIMLTWGGYASGVVSHTEVWRHSTNNLGSATLLGTAPGFVYVDEVGEAETWYYWLRTVITRNGVTFYSEFHDTNGVTATTAISPAALLEALANQITESELAGALSSRIDLIDTPTTGLVDSLAQEITDRVNAINTEITNRQNADNQLQTQISDLVAASAAETYIQAAKPLPGVGDTPDPIPDFARWYDSDDDNKPYIWIEKDLLTASYQWTASGNEYFLELSGGGNPGLNINGDNTNAPDALYHDSGGGPVLLTKTTGALSVGEWKYESNTVYVRLTGDVSPTGQTGLCILWWADTSDGRILQLDTDLTTLTNTVNHSTTGLSNTYTLANSAYGAAVTGPDSNTVLAGRVDDVEVELREGLVNEFPDPGFDDGLPPGAQGTACRIAVGMGRSGDALELYAGTGGYPSVWNHDPDLGWPDWQQGEKWNLSFWYKNTCTTDKEIGYGGGGGYAQVTLPANTSTWTFVNRNFTVVANFVSPPEFDIRLPDGNWDGTVLLDDVALVRGHHTLDGTEVISRRPLSLAVAKAHDATKTSVTGILTNPDNAGTWASFEAMAQRVTSLDTDVGDGVASGLIYDVQQVNSTLSNPDGFGTWASLVAMATDVKLMKATVGDGNSGLVSQMATVEARLDDVHGDGSNKTVEVLATESTQLEARVDDQLWKRSGDNFVADPNMFFVGRDGLGAIWQTNNYTGWDWSVDATGNEDGLPCLRGDAYYPTGTNNDLPQKPEFRFPLARDQRDFFLEVRVNFQSGYNGDFAFGMRTYDKDGAVAGHPAITVDGSAQPQNTWVTLKGKLNVGDATRRSAEAWLSVRETATGGHVKVGFFRISQLEAGADVTAESTAYQTLVNRVNLTTDPNYADIEAVASLLTDLSTTVQTGTPTGAVTADAGFDKASSVETRIGVTPGGAGSIEAIATDVDSLVTSITTGSPDGNVTSNAGYDKAVAVENRIGITPGGADSFEDVVSRSEYLEAGIQIAPSVTLIEGAALPNTLGLPVRIPFRIYHTTGGGIPTWYRIAKVQLHTTNSPVGYKAFDLSGSLRWGATNRMRFQSTVHLHVETGADFQNVNTADTRLLYSGTKITATFLARYESNFYGVLVSVYLRVPQDYQGVEADFILGGNHDYPVSQIWQRGETALTTEPSSGAEVVAEPNLDEDYWDVIRNHPNAPKDNADVTATASAFTTLEGRVNGTFGNPPSGKDIEAIVTDQTTLEARLDQNVGGNAVLLNWRLTGKWADLPGAALYSESTVTNLAGAAPDGATALRISYLDGGTVGDTQTEGIRFTVPAEICEVVWGKTIRVRLRIQEATSGLAASQIMVTYYTNHNGNSGNQTLNVPLTWGWVEFTYAVPQPSGQITASHAITIRADASGAGGSTEFADIRIELDQPSYEDAIALAPRAISAAVNDERVARVTQGEGFASDIQTLNTSITGDPNLGNAAVTLEELKKVVIDSNTGLQAMYTVKMQVDTNDGRKYISGFGLSTSLTETGQVESDVFFNVDNFTIGRLDDNGVADLVFTTDNGSVVMDGAYIQDATIVNAKIQTLDANKIFVVSGTIADAVIGTGHLTNAMIGQIIQSDNYNAVSHTGWIIDKTGLAEFQGFRLYDDSGKLILGAGNGYKVGHDNLLSAQLLHYPFEDVESGSLPDNTLQDWDVVLNSSATIAMATATGAYGAGNVLQVNGDVYLRGKSALYVPYDPGAVYRVRVVATRQNAVTGTLRIGVMGVGADGVTWVEPDGTGDNPYTGHYVLQTTAMNSAWTVYEGFITGATASATSAGDAKTDRTVNGVNLAVGGGTLGNPIIAHEDVRFLTPLIHTNAGGVNTEITSFASVTIERVQEQLTAANVSTYIADLAVDTLQIKGNAVTVPVGVFVGTDFNATASFSDVCGTSGITPNQNGQAQVHFNVTMNGATSNPNLVQFRIQYTVNGGARQDLYTGNDDQAIQNYASFATQMAVTGGDEYHFYLQCKGTGNTIHTAALTVIGVMR